MSFLKSEVNNLIRAIQLGDTSKEKELYDLTYNSLKIIALKYALDKNDYEDILMEAYIRAFRYIKCVDITKDGYNWLCKIVQNAALDINKEIIPIIPLEEISLTKVVGDFREIIELKDEALREMCKLPEYEQRIVYLRFYEGLSYSEIAKVVKGKKSTVHKQIKAIIKKLN